MYTPVFDPNNLFWRTISRLVDIVGLSICWLLCSLPVITLCASTTALYDAVYHCVRRQEGGSTYLRFFGTLRRELKTGVLIALPGLAAALLFRQLVSFGSSLAVEGDRVAEVLVYACQCVFCIPLAVWLFACALLSRFTFTPRALLATAAKLVFAHLPSALVVAVAVLLLAGVALWWPISMFFLPALAALFASFFLERIFKPFL